MPNSLLSLARRMERVDKKITKKRAELVRLVAFNTLVELVTSTPVDVSTALSNWQVAVNDPVLTEINAFFAGKFGTTQSSSVSAAVRAARSELRSVKAGDTVIISNLVDYIEQLNNGRSNQAPAGFVQRAILVGRETVKAFKMDL